MSDINIYSKINTIKTELSKTELKKTGHNKHLNFKYHELSDFLGAITRLNQENGVHENITMNNDIATLTLTNVDKPSEQVTITIPFVMADMQPKNDGIQKLGASLTYLRRYLYVQAYAITEHEIVDAQDQSTTTISDKENQQAQQKLLSWLVNESDEDTAQTIIDNVLKEYNINSISQLDFNKVNKKELMANIKKQLPKKESF